MDKKTSDFGSFTCLYMYGNEEKADALLSNIYSSVLTQVETQKSRGKTLTGGIKGEVNKLLAKLGLPEIELGIEGNISSENVKSFVTAINFESKVKRLVSYWKEHCKMPCINLQTGEMYYYEKNKRINQKMSLEGNPLGVVRGTFIAKREYPPLEAGGGFGLDIINMDHRKMKLDSMIDDFFKNNPSDYLWNLSTVQGSMIKGEIPILIGNIRTVSQYAAVSLVKSSEYKMEAIGVLHETEDKIMCDPLAIQMIF